MIIALLAAAALQTAPPGYLHCTPTGGSACAQAYAHLECWRQANHPAAQAACERRRNRAYARQYGPTKP